MLNIKQVYEHRAQQGSGKLAEYVASDEIPSEFSGDREADRNSRIDMCIAVFRRTHDCHKNSQSPTRCDDQPAGTAAFGAS